MMINRRMFLAGSASTAVLAALAACASSSNSDGGSENLKQAVNVVARDKVKDGGELKFALSDPIANWNNSTVEGNTAAMSQIFAFISPSLFLYDSAGKATPRPEFFKSIKGEVKNGKTVVSIELNDKAVWGDGKKIVADDYIKSATNKDYGWASTDGLVDIEKFEKESDTKFSITWKSTYPDWSAVITVMPQAQVATPAAFNDGVKDATKYKNEWFAGPYKIKSYDAAQQLVTLERNEKWWGDKGKLDKITFRYLDSAATAGAFANKEVDVLRSIVTADTFKQAQTRTDAEVRQNFGLQYRHVTINGSHGILSDKAVRQAFLLGTNRQEIASALLAGLPVKPKDFLLGNHFFMPTQKNEYKDNGAQWAYNVEKAKKLLDEAGWKEPSAGAIREKNGKKLTIYYTRPTGVVTTKNESELLQNQLKKIGIDLQMKEVESASYFKTISQKNFEVTGFAWQLTQYPMNNIGQVYGKDSQSNFSGYSVDAIDEAIKKIAVETDNAKRVEMTNKVDALIWENVMNFPLYQRPDLCGVPKKLANYGAFGLATVRGEDVGFVD